MSAENIKLCIVILVNAYKKTGNPILKEMYTKYYYELRNAQ